MRLKTLFSGNSYDLYSLDTKYVVTEDVVSNTFPNVHKRRRKQANEFLQSRLWNRSKAISYTVTKNYNSSAWKLHSTAGNTINYRRQETKLLFFLAYLSLVRQWKETWNTFLGHELQVYHPYLSEHGSLRTAKRKSSIIKCILQEYFTSPDEDANISGKHLTV